VLEIHGFYEVQILFVIIIAGVWVVLVTLTVITFYHYLILYAKKESVIEDRDNPWSDTETA
jgi:hypothetical protein